MPDKSAIEIAVRMNTSAQFGLQSGGAGETDDRNNSESERDRDNATKLKNLTKLFNGEIPLASMQVPNSNFGGLRSYVFL